MGAASHTTQSTGWRRVGSDPAGGHHHGTLSDERRRQPSHGELRNGAYTSVPDRVINSMEPTALPRV